jgi:hypothetical protein
MTQPSLTGNLCIPWINITWYGAVTKYAQSPQRPGCYDSMDILMLKLQCNKQSTNRKTIALRLSERRPHFETHQFLEENKNLGQIKILR